MTDNSPVDAQPELTQAAVVGPDPVKWTYQELLDANNTAQAYQEAKGFELLAASRYIVEADTDVSNTDASVHTKRDFADALWNYERAVAAALLTHARLDGFEAGLDAPIQGRD